MLQFRAFSIDAEGRVVRKGKVYYDPKQPPSLTSTFNDSNQSALSAAGLAICNTDVTLTIQRAFCREMPTVMHEMMVADHMGELAINYRRYVRHMMLPTMLRIMDALLEHSAVRTCAQFVPWCHARAAHTDRLLRLSNFQAKPGCNRCSPKMPVSHNTRPLPIAIAVADSD